MRYYKLISDKEHELLAICKCEDDLSSLPWRESNLDEQICEKIGTRKWMWADSTQVEFETYQAFGIMEIKL